MDEKLDNILNELQIIRQEITELKIICNRMDQHIDFVEYTYEGLKTPIEFVKYYVGKIPRPSILN